MRLVLISALHDGRRREEVLAGGPLGGNRGGLVGEPAIAEAAHLFHEREKVPALAGQRILDPRRQLRVLVTLDDALLFQLPKAERERPGTDSLERTLELAEPGATALQVTDDEDGPLGADDVGGAADGTVVVGGHSDTLPSEVRRAGGQAVRPA